MKQISQVFFFFSLAALAAGSQASTTIQPGQFDNIHKTELTSEQQREQLSTTAGLLADYEIKAKKLVNSLSSNSLQADSVNLQAQQLLDLSTEVIETYALAKQGDERFSVLQLQDFESVLALQAQQHVLVLTRDDPTMASTTRDTIAAEINEVLAHTEVVRELVIY